MSQGVSISEGDCVLVRTGFGQYFETEPDKYLHKCAGLAADSAQWLADKKPRLVGTDNLSLGNPSPFAPHRILLVENGIYVMKSLTLETLAEDKHYISTVVVLPLKIKGGEASLVRPVSIA